MNAPDVWAVAIDPVAKCVLLNTGDLAAVEDYLDDDLEPVDPLEATTVLYSIGVNDQGSEWACMTDLELLEVFTVH